jgi:HK97 family phage major capsid protein
MAKLQVKTDGLTGEALEFAKSLNTAMAEMPEGITKTELTEALEALKGQLPTNETLKAEMVVKIDELKGIVAKSNAEILSLKATGAGADVPKTLKEAVIKSLSTPEMKSSLEKLKTNDISSLGEIVIKAAVTMTEAASLNGSAYIPQPQFLPGVINLVRNKPYLLDYLPVMAASSSRIVWNEKTNAQGTAQFIAEGVVKPLISFELISRTSEAAKIADKIKVSTEMLDDIPYIASEINNELKYQVDIAVDNALLTGAGAPSLTGITASASAYVLTSISTPNPNNSDALRAGKAQLSSLNFDANLAVMNPIDMANMDLEKATTSGVYMLPPFITADGRTISGMRVIEENQMPLGHVLIMDTTKAKVFTWQDFVIKIGYVNDDFEKNLVTIIGEKRLHFFIPQNWTNAFLYDTLANIKTAITP